MMSPTTNLTSLVLAIAGALACVLNSSARADADRSKVEYRVDLPAPQTQMVELSIRVSEIASDELDFCLPIWRPGRYVVADPASTVRQVRAIGDRGQTLQFRKTDKSTWRVSTGGSPSVTLHYRVYANSLNDRTRHVDDTHAFLSPAAVFMYVPERRGDPLSVHINAPESWHVACGLDSAPGNPRVLLAPNYDVLVDSPLEIGQHEVIDFEAAGKPHQIVLWGHVSQAFDRNDLKKDFAAIIVQAASMFSRVPYDRYLFILHVGAGARGGTEHLNSTVMQVSHDAFEDSSAYRRLLSLTAHEYFHTWNVKQFRPKDLHPYDYQRENYTDLLWVCEGTTTYFTQLLLVRSELRKPDKYLEDLATSIGAMRNRPSESVQSVAEASFDSWIHYGRSTPDDDNAVISFYGKGALVSLLLDMHIREKTGNTRSLDAVMHELFERFPLSGRGYTSNDLLSIINELTNADFAEFFRNYVTSAQPLPLEQALKTVGLELYFKAAETSDDDDADEKQDSEPTSTETDHETDRPSADRAASAQRGATEIANGETAEKIIDHAAADATSASDDVLSGETGKAHQPTEESTPQSAYLGLKLNGTIVESVLSDGPAYMAGLIAGDEVLAVDGRRVGGESDLADRLEKLTPSKTIEVLFSRHGQVRTLTITLGGKPDGEWAIRRVKEATQKQKDAYKSWLGQAWPEKTTK